MQAVRRLVAFLEIGQRVCEERAREQLAAARADLLDLLRFWPHWEGRNRGLRIFALLAELERRMGEKP